MAEQPGQTGLMGAADRMAALLGNDLTIPETEPPVTRSDAPRTEPRPRRMEYPGQVKAQRAEPTPEAPAETPETPPEPEEEQEPPAQTPEPPAEAEAEPEQEQEQAEDGKQTEPHYAVKIDGREEKVPLSELIAGYSRSGDYTRKTQALAADRRSFESEQQTIRVEREQYARLLPALQEQLTRAAGQEPDWNRLMAENPDEFVRQREYWRLHNERVQAVQQEQQRVMAAMSQDALKIREQRSEQGQKQLFEEHPEFKKSEVWEPTRQKLVERLYQRHHLNDQEVSVITLYPTILSDMYKAHKYDELMAKKPKPVVQRSPAVASPGSAETQPRPANVVTRAKQRLAKTGSVHDAAALFEQMLD